MKKINLQLLCTFLVAVCLVSFSSCSSDDDNENPAPDANTIVGTWKLAAQKCEVDVTPATLKEAIEKYLKSDTFDEKLPQGTLVMEKDGTYQTTYIYEGETVADEERGVYEYKNNKITFTPNAVQPRTDDDDDLSPQTFDVKLNASGLALSMDRTAASKVEFDKATTWEFMGIEKPAGFNLTKSLIISTFVVAPMHK